MSGPVDVVEIVEVSPRDGLQNEPTVLSPGDRAALIRLLMASGAKRIEAVSFVHPRRVPQMAEPEAVLDLVGEHDGTSLIGLVLNWRGAERAVATPWIDEINYVVPTTDAFGRANQGVSTEEALQQGQAIRDLARESGRRFSVTLAVAFGCPYEGDVAPGRLLDVVRGAAALAPDELAVADTIGCAVPSDVTRVLAGVRDLTDADLRVHFHETRHTGLANVLAAVDAGVRIVDSSAAGVGGCPFAPGSAGNVSTEDVVWMLRRSGFMADVSVDKASAFLCDALGIRTRSGVGAAGAFPPDGRSSVGTVSETQQ